MGWAGGGGGSGGGAVSSVFARVGAVVALAGDYTVAQITGAAGLASPALTGNPTATTQAALDDSNKIATTAYVDTAIAVVTGELGSLAFVTPTGTASAATYLRGDGTWSMTPPVFFFNMSTASVATSPPYPPMQTAAEVGACYLSCSTAPTGSNLVMVARYSTDGGTTWNTIITLTIVAGSSATVTGTANVTVPVGAIIDCQCTSAGSTAAATGVVFSGFPE